jgi:hypothetical protein
MINPKYDPTNYLKHLAIPVITDNQKINQLFGSYLLRVRWWHDNPKVSLPSDLIGTLRVHTDTPFGALEPRDYRFKVSSHKQIYVQFLTIPIPEFEYKIEVIHPVGLTRSKIELWEYMPPQIFTENNLASSSSSGAISLLSSPSPITINNMGVNYGATDPAAANIAIATTQNLSYVPAVAGVIQVAPATPTRAPGGMITNNSNSDIYVSFGATVPAANIGLPLLPKVKSGIPSNMDIPEGYKGQIQAFCVSPAGGGGVITGGLNVMDFTYI